MFAKTKDGLYQRVVAGNWQGWMKADVQEASSVYHCWHGERISLYTWRQILAFFEWSMAETDSEAMVNLFYHVSPQSRGWMPLVLPQKGYSGMTVSLIDDHPNLAPTMARLGGGPGDVYMISSVHHHCQSSAFQSGGDARDEATKEGLHITVGNIGSNRYSIHSRACLRNTVLDVNLDDWFELDELVAELVPVELHSKLLEIELTKPPKDVAFPEWWKDNVIKVERPAYSYSPGGIWSPGQSCAPQPQRPLWHEEDYETWQESKKGKQEPEVTLDIEEEFLDFCNQWGVDMEELADYFSNHEGDFGEAVHSMLRRLGLDVSMAARVAEEIIKDAVGDDNETT